MPTAMKMPASRSPVAIPSWMTRLGSRDTTPAPSQPPAIIATMSETSSVRSTETTLMKANAWTTTGSV